jgi:IS5 family transposase
LVASQANPATRPGEKKAINRAYSELLAIARTTVTQSRAVTKALHDSAAVAAQRLQQQFADLLPLVEQVIAQTERRVLKGESVPAAEKVVSLVEPHTQIICRGKAPPRDTEFGHKVDYAEVDGGLIIAWKVIATGNPPDESWLVPALREHRRLFHHAPQVLAGDRGFFSPDNKRQARQMGVKQFAVPQTGRLTKQQRQREKQPWFKQGQRFRNGIEGRISVVRRTVQLTRCPNHGLDGFERWIGWGIIVANLVVIARKIRRRHRGSKR